MSHGTLLSGGASVTRSPPSARFSSGLRKARRNATGRQATSTRPHSNTVSSWPISAWSTATPSINALRSTVRVSSRRTDQRLCSQLEQRLVIARRSQDGLVQLNPTQTFWMTRKGVRLRLDLRCNAVTRTFRGSATDITGATIPPGADRGTSLERCGARGADDDILDTQAAAALRVANRNTDDCPPNPRPISTITARSA